MRRILPRRARTTRRTAFLAIFCCTLLAVAPIFEPSLLRSSYWYIDLLIFLAIFLVMVHDLFAAPRGISWRKAVASLKWPRIPGPFQENGVKLPNRRDLRRANLAEQRKIARDAILSVGNDIRESEMPASERSKAFTHLVAAMTACLCDDFVETYRSIGTARAMLSNSSTHEKAAGFIQSDD